TIFLFAHAIPVCTCSHVTKNSEFNLIDRFHFNRLLAKSANRSPVCANKSTKWNKMKALRSSTCMYAADPKVANPKIHFEEIVGLAWFSMIAQPSQIEKYTNNTQQPTIERSPFAHDVQAFLIVPSVLSVCISSAHSPPTNSQRVRCIHDNKLEKITSAILTKGRPYLFQYLRYTCSINNL
ncbi:hypothetical protein Tcan_00541, partial [Toxocara canis]